MHRPSDPAGFGAGVVVRFARPLFALLLVALLAPAIRVAAQDANARPAMGGGNAAHTGEQPGPGPAGAPQLRWAFATGDRVRSSPAVVDGTVFVGSADSWFYAIDADTGAERWRFATGGGIVSAPAVVSGVAYVVSQDGYLYALDTATGEQRWRFRAGLAHAPTVADGTVFLGGANHMLYALDAATGVERWHYQSLSAAMTAPTVVGQSVYAGTGDGYLVALNANTGAERWLRKSGAMVLSSPAVDDGVVVFTASAAEIIEQNEATGPVTRNQAGEEARLDDDLVRSRAIPGLSLVALDTESGDFRWHHVLDSEHVADAQIGAFAVPASAAAIASGVVYAGSESGQLQAIDLFTGRQRWGAFLDGILMAAPAVTGGVVYVGTYGNAVAALDAATGAPVWSFATGHRVHSSPAVAGGVVFAGADDGYLYAIGGS